jgi:hypothetical protein
MPFLASRPLEQEQSAGTCHCPADSFASCASSCCDPCCAFCAAPRGLLRCLGGPTSCPPCLPLSLGNSVVPFGKGRLCHNQSITITPLGSPTSQRRPSMQWSSCTAAISREASPEQADDTARQARTPAHLRNVFLELCHVRVLAGGVGGVFNAVGHFQVTVVSCTLTLVNTSCPLLHSLYWLWRTLSCETWLPAIWKHSTV